jgi:GAF domain-containing protein/ActR/RegA family two-component response regulator
MTKQPLRVLLVGNVAALRDSMEKALRKNNDYLVDAVSDDKQAWEFVTQSERPYTVVVINSMLSATNGLESEHSGIDLMRKIKSNLPQARFIILTDQSDEQALDALQAGAFHSLASPYDAEKLAGLIHQSAKYQQVNGTSREKQILEQLREGSIPSRKGQRSQQEILDALVRNIHVIGFDRVALYLLSDDERYLVGRAHVGRGEDFIGSKWDALTDSHLQEILNAPHLSICTPEDEGLTAFETVLVEEGVDKWACVPIVLRERVIGHIIADNKITGYQIPEENLGPLVLFASQAASAIESAHLYSELEKRARNLSAVLKGSSSVNSTLELDQMLTQACQLAVELLDVSHGGLVLFDQDFEYGTVRAEYPEIGTKGLKIQVRGVPVEEKLLELMQPIVIEDLIREPSFGSVRDKNLELGIQSILLVPVVYKGKIIGSFGLDVINKTRRFSPEEINLCQIFADQTAAAIANARLFELNQQRADELESLHRATEAITLQLDRNTLLNRIIQEAMQLLKGKGGGIYEYKEERGELIVIADYDRQDRYGISLKLGEGLAGILVRDDLPFMIIDDYLNWEGRAPIYTEKRPFGSVVEVPLKWQEKTIGVIYIEDVVGRKFTPEDAHLLRLFANQAAIALVNAEFILKDQEKVRRLEKLSQATKEIIGGLEATKFDDRLMLIAKYATDILETETCGVFLVKDGYLSLEASYGHREGGFEKGKRLAICSVPGSGLTGHIAHQRRIFKAHGKELISLPVVRGVEPHHGPGGNLYSMLAIPLKKKVDQREELLGLLRVDNKKGKDGLALPTIEFTEEDEWILNIFAETVVEAIESTELVEQLREHRDQLELLLKTSNVLVNAENLTDGLQNLAELIATHLGHTFCRVLLCDESHQFLTVKAAYPSLHSKAKLAWDPGLGERIQWPGLEERLDAGVPWVRRMSDPTNQAVLLEFSRRQSLEKNVQSLLLIPLTMRGKHVGLLNLGEIKDDPRSQFTDEQIKLAGAIAAQATVLIDRMRLHEVTKHHEEELIRLDIAAQAMSGEFDFKKVLRSIVKTAKEMLQGDSSTIWPYDQGLSRFITEKLEVEGIPSEFLEEFKNLDPQPGGITFTVKDMDWVAVSDVDASKEELTFLQVPRRAILKKMGVKSFQGIVLKIGSELVGVLYVNYNRARTFGEDDRRSMESLARYAALSLKKAGLLDRVTRSKKAAKAVAKYTAIGNRKKTLSEVTKGTLKTLGCDSVTLYAYDEASDKCDPPTVKGALKPGRAPEYSPDSIIHKMLWQDKRYHAVENIDEDDDFKGTWFAKDENIKSCLAIPLKVVDHTMGVMFVNYLTHHHFTTDELTDITLFANQAAIALRNVQLFEEHAKKLREQEALVELSNKLLGTVNSQEILNQAVAIAKRELGADLCNIVLPDKKGNLLFVALEGNWQGVEIGKTRVENGGRSQIGLTIESEQPIKIVNYAKEDDFAPSAIILDNQIVSGMSVPIFSGGKVVGAMLVHTKTLRHFSKAEENLLCLIANQTAVAINSAQQYNALERQSRYLRRLHEAGKVITASVGLERRKVLDQIVKQAVEIIIGSRKNGQGFGTIQLYEEATHELTFESFYSPNESIQPLRAIGVGRYLDENKIGITGRTVLTASPQLVSDVSTDPDYFVFNSRTRSELDVPLIEKDKVLGVLNLEIDDPEAFNDDDLFTLQALAELAVIAIQNARQYDDLNQAKGLVAARTALALMGMATNAWSHQIAANAIHIRNEVTLMRGKLKQDSASAKLTEKGLERIEENALEIVKRKIIAPLSSEEGLSSVNINDLIKKRIGQLWETEPYNTVRKQLVLVAPQETTVNCNPDWLRRALDILIDNAVRAMAGDSDHLLTISTEIVNDTIEIGVADTGSGIPDEILPNLFIQVKDLPYRKGMGIGLLMAHLIIEVYGGKMEVRSSNSKGTIIVIQLPVEPVRK